uniref:Receptor-type tyrosine-protein phosphatase T n=1 Tax=Magallana gigas TaxID=29159 RepID=A0A8W8KJC8_MAGGI
MEMTFLLLVLQFLIVFKVTEGQCDSNGKCVCHCENCNPKCIACLPGWSGSTTNLCQKRNAFFHPNATDKLFDGDLNTYKMAEGRDPFFRVQYNYSTEIDQLDITAVLENGIPYTIFVKQLPYTRDKLEICSKFTYSNRSITKTVTVTCNRPLQGKYIEIVASSSTETTLKVFEIERFGDCFSCISGYYGVRCDKKCSSGCQDSCNMTSGFCVCKPGFYSNNCSLQCPTMCFNSECHQEKGTCLACNYGTYGDRCDLKCLGDCNGQCDRRKGICGICAKNKYGTYCNQTCPINCAAGACIRDTGYCKKCKIGYMGDKCNESCPDHCVYCDQNGYKCQTCANKRYGVQCESICPLECGENGSCDIETGICDVCPAGYFGKSCTQRCSEWCDSSNICDQITGQCQNCIAGRYGPNCLEQCRIQCVNSTCFSNQTCAHGCEDGWFGAQCDNKCNAAVLNCVQCYLMDNAPVCTHCADRWYLMETNCIKCPENCSLCVSSEECLECKNNFYYGKTCNLTCNTACIKKTCDITGSCRHGCDNSKYGKECDKDCMKHCKTCLNSTMCLECEAGYFGKSCTMCPENCKKCENRSTCTHCKIGLTHDNGKCLEKNKKHPDATCLGGGENNDSNCNDQRHCYENAGISVYNTRGSQALLEEIDPDEQDNDTDVDEFESHDYVNVNMTRISLQRLWEYKLQNAANDLMNTEFETLPTGLLLKCKEAKKSENKKRNRYKYVYPYDANRVMLSTDGEKLINSYINASYINGFEAPKEYIASQGPFTDETVADFWRMVWNENVNTIVILINLEEAGVENESRTVEQFHFTAWPEKGLPSTVNSILDFWRKIRSKADITSPIVVHCSAGIGRTGTFIALDILINQGQKEGSVDVVSCVANLRYQRTHLIQTVEQYKYLYSAVTKELTGKESGIQENEFMTYYSQLKHNDQLTGRTFIEEEFDLIEKLAPGFDENRYQTAKAVNNRHKNRHSNILADDNFRIHISRQGSDYINAISLPSVQQNVAYIITQKPLPETVDDFYLMMADQEVNTIVLLDNDADEVFGNGCRSKNETFSQNLFELNPQEKTTFGNIELLTCHFHDDHALISRVVKLYHGRFWNENRLVPNGFQSMISLVETILIRRREQNENPIVVVCRDGAQRSGLFCVLANLVEQIQLSGSVDILQTVLNVRHRRPQIVPCLEQLEYIYDFIENYLESGNKV